MKFILTLFQFFPEVQHASPPRTKQLRRDNELNMARLGKRCSRLMILIVQLAFLLFLQFSLPGTTGARVYAYIDAKGEIYCTPIEGGELRKLRSKSGKVSNPLIFVGRSTLPSKSTRAPKRNDLVIGSFNEFIQTAAMKNRVDPLLIMAVIKAESNFDPGAVSSKGAQGLMQLMPATARDLQIADPYDPQENIFGGTKYLRSLLDSYKGDVELSLAAYNAGPGNVKNKIPNIRETKMYVSNVLENYQSYRGK